MCGIAGWLSRDGSPPATALVGEITDHIRHRGPDDGHVWTDGPVCLGHRRLSIIDLHPRGRQPMLDAATGVAITYNGEIYNYKELRQELAAGGYRFETETDTEVVLAGYLAWGAACLPRFVGMFAFALWDPRDRSVLLARDPLGIKPLLYALDERRLVFASEMQALTRSRAVEPRLDRAGFLDMLTFAADLDPHTCVAGVASLPAGEALRIDARGSRGWRYWAASPPASPTPFDPQAFERATCETIRKTLVADVPVGVFLSAGVDSNVVATCAADATGAALDAYVMSFPVANFDEAPDAVGAARALGLRPHVEQLPDTGFADLVERVMTHSGEITPNPSFIATWHLAARAARDVKVILSGDGPDELLAGYPTYPASLLAAPVNRLVPPALLARLGGFVDAKPAGFRKNDWRERWQRFLYGARRPGADRHGVWRIIVRPELFSGLLHPDLAAEIRALPDPVSESYGAALGEIDVGTDLQRLCAVDTRIYLPNDGLVKMDRVGMAHGLEIRVPFLNHDYVAQTLALGDEARRRVRLSPRPGIEQKSGLKRAFAHRLPAHVLHGAKRGFNAPAGEWINGSARTLVDDVLTPETLARQAIFDPGFVAGKLGAHRERRTDESHLLWLVLATTLWARREGVTA
ncbi:asparagine synthase (glutamine-hydrolyzing) [Salinarimonas sp. NSM]|uniref:asparagine synthase (glutamine-hydrolyzing) n=1 Tax=Salinarimonas sp. NSM TaxID=3458003 RepID=UPI0040374BD0